MKILIVGSDLNAKLLAQYLKMEDESHDIYMTESEKIEDSSYTVLAVKEHDIRNICGFVKYNQIEFTIVTSSIAIINGIADVFKKEGFAIFAPFSEAARVTFFNSIAKKIMYKLKINTPKFGIFDRENLALDYLRRTKFPVVVENDFTLFGRKLTIFKTFSKSKLGLQQFFEQINDRVVIEEYIDENPIYVYFATDGYNAIPLISVSRVSGEGYTCVSVPVEKLNEDILLDILNKAVYPLLDDITKFAGMYIGILGLKVKIKNGNFFVYEFYNGFQYYDFQAFISLLDDNLFSILYDCANGCLADEHDFINMSDKYSYTVAIDKSKIKSDLSDNDFIITEDNTKYICTYSASTMNRAKTVLLDYLKQNVDEDIIDLIEESEYEKDLVY